MSGWQQQLKAELAAAAQADPTFPEDRFADRGIVICAGGARLFTCAWIAIGLLRRHLGCDLPIEVWHLGPQELGPPMRGLLEELGAQPVDALEVAKRHPVRRLGGWELKPYAMMHSRFRELLLLDADNIPIKDPVYLFDCPEYRAGGALFWPDLVRLSPDNEIWAIGDLAYRPMPSFESGQIVVDKSRSWRALCLAHWINQRSEVFYRFLHGDKDTFLLAWLMLRQSYHLIAHRPKLLDATMCQRAPDGTVLFQHRNHAKWILDGDNPRIAGFRMEDECRALLEELATVWDGRIFNPPQRSDEARRIEADLARIRDFSLTRVSSDERRIALLPDHRIRSSVGLERYWYVADGVEGPELRIDGMGLQVCTLRYCDDGRWRGRLLQSPGMPVEMVPQPAARAAGANLPSGDGNEATALLERVLDIAAALPSDREVMRDILGALRILTTLDASLGQRLRDEGERWPPTTARARAIKAALDGLSVGRDDDGGGIAPGHDWLNAAFKLGRGYERL